ncbi:2,3-bisphosphoglycerate-independent phosphoglycerate mutase [Clostridium cylindrosporum]|uniref:2,3-bisphosphoglycerate-independent phosphoglycerate mutase n=1 Tax=Clostridium cylindrosporum DSM 605 TaxID=1121307 RepID=A0A0J8D3P7_CLOCY|nr:2,3-bisphosphoglycerate-independent phosphoglycerate mutase [Clostridium cylindrosporum]KMT20800.1 2,3-bisphosphoglycerate-independent phosphoglycerate mutase GpmI [Clostridium cylindrosporum DSM 605]
MKKATKMLLILDGYGIRNEEKGNAVVDAKKPNLDKYFNTYPKTFLNASGLSVGLPEGQMGNSEVGHLNIGAGRVIYQELTRINKEISEGGFFKNEALLKAIDYSRRNNSSIHLMGLLSDGGVHSHIDHLKALLKLCKEEGLTKVYVHGFLDGRDVPPQSALEYVESLESYIKEVGVGSIATISGRYYAMDRDNRWERVQKAYDAMVKSEGPTFDSAAKAIESSYKDKVLDEFVVPSVIVKDGSPVASISNKDSVIFFNFRPDRAREITRALTERNFDGFKSDYIETYFVSMTQYDKSFKNLNIAYKPENIENTLGETLSKKGKRQLRIAETEKYAHVTFFFNGGVETPYQGEDRILVPSPKVATYDMQPEMSAGEVTERVLKEISEGIYDFILLNFANPDMVGHTGDLDAAIKAVETVDECTGKIVEAILQNGGAVYITADHGNAEQMIDPENGEAFTAHTINKVPFVVIGEGDVHLREDGKISDIAPTILNFMELDVPVEMTGESLLTN